MLETSPQVTPMPQPPAPPEIFCSAPGCKATVPAELAPEGLCVMHLTFQMEQACARLRCEIVQGTTTPERAAEIADHIVRLTAELARIASGISLPDDRKKRVLNTFLTLMIVRETLDRVMLGRASRRRSLSSELGGNL